MLHPTDRIANITAFVTPVVEHLLEREIAQWVQPMKDRSDDPSYHERTLLPRSYISLQTSDECLRVWDMLKAGISSRTISRRLISTKKQYTASHKCLYKPEPLGIDHDAAG